MGLLVQSAVSAVKAGFLEAFSVESGSGAPNAAGTAVSAPSRLQLCAEYIAARADDEAAVEGLERVYALYMEYCILQDGGAWGNVLGPALEVLECPRLLAQSRLLIMWASNFNIFEKLAESHGMPTELHGVCAFEPDAILHTVLH